MIDYQIWCGLCGEALDGDASKESISQGPDRRFRLVAQFFLDTMDDGQLQSL